MIIALLLSINNTKINQNYLFFISETKNKGQNFEILWSAIRRSTTYNAGSKKCNLCLWEKFHIMAGDKEKILNEWNELITKCRHVDKFLLKNYKSKRRWGEGKR